MVLKSFPHKHQLEKVKYSFDLTLCNDLFGILLEKNLIILNEGLLLARKLPPDKAAREREAWGVCEN